jgi:hypothetical protein
MVYLYFTDVNKDAKPINLFIQNRKSFLANIMSNPIYFSDQIQQIQVKILATQVFLLSKI